MTTGSENSETTPSKALRRFAWAAKEASIIGKVCEEPTRMVLMHTGFGGTRMIDMLVGDSLPRIY